MIEMALKLQFLQQNHKNFPAAGGSAPFVMRTHELHWLVQQRV